VSDLEGTVPPLPQDDPMRAEAERAMANEMLTDSIRYYFDLTLRELLRHDLTRFASSSGIKPEDIVQRAMTYAQMAAGAMLETQYPNLAAVVRRGMQADDPEPPTVSFCVCGHPKGDHMALHGVCRHARGIAADPLCNCAGYSQRP